MDAALAPLFMTVSDFQATRRAMQRLSDASSVMQWLAGLGMRGFLSAAQAGELFPLYKGEDARECAFVLCHRTLDRWHMKINGDEHHDDSPFHDVDIGCQYSLSPHVFDVLARMAPPAASAYEIRAALLKNLYCQEVSDFNRCDVDPHVVGKLKTFLLAIAIRERSRKLDRWRRLAPRVGWLALRVRRLYEEVHHRPGNPGALSAQQNFEELAAGGAQENGGQANQSADEALAANESGVSAVMRGLSTAALAAARGVLRAAGGTKRRRDGDGDVGE